MPGKDGFAEARRDDDRCGQADAFENRGTDIFAGKAAIRLAPITDFIGANSEPKRSYVLIRKKQLHVQAI